MMFLQKTLRDKPGEPVGSHSPLASYGMATDMMPDHGLVSPTAFTQCPDT
jgi:hypothetical protein